jgi:hypothetical protein
VSWLGGVGGVVVLHYECKLFENVDEVLVIRKGCRVVGWFEGSFGFRL